MILLWTVRLYQAPSGFKVTIRDGVNRVTGAGATPDAACRNAEKHLTAEPLAALSRDGT